MGQAKTDSAKISENINGKEFYNIVFNKVVIKIKFFHFSLFGGPENIMKATNSLRVYVCWVIYSIVKVVFCEVWKKFLV